MLRTGGGNSRHRPFDYLHVNCHAAREAISALLDGEAPAVEASALEAHLAGCAACRQWREQAHELTRSVRLQAARPLPRPPAGLTELLRRESRTWPWRAGQLARTRIALVIVAGAQLALSVPVLILGQDHSAPLHVAHEMGSFDVAVAAGFLVAARRPARAMGMLSLMAVAAGLLVLTAVLDLLGGRTSCLDEAPHLLVVAGWLLLRRLAQLAPPSWDRPLTVSSRLAPTTLARAVRLARARPAGPPKALLDGGVPVAARHPRASEDRPQKAVG